MKRWKLFLFVWVTFLFTAGVGVVACGSPVETDKEIAQEQPTAQTDGGITSDAGEQTPQQEQPTQPDEQKAEPTQPDAPVAKDDPPNTETPSEGSVGPEDTPTEPLPPWTKEEPAPPKAYTGGTCPTFKAGTNTFQSGGKTRAVDVYLPQPQPAEGAALLFMWHGLGDNPQRFAQSFGAPQISSNQNAIIIVPKGVSGPTIPSDVPPGIVSLLKSQAQAFFETWSFFDNQSADLILFDDVLTCLDQQFKINRKKVYTSGFSAGALWSTYLTMHRSEYLAAALILSGGVMEKILDLATIPLLNSKSKVKVVNIPYTTPSHTVPVMLTAGGSKDVVSMSSFISFEFQPSTDALRTALVKDGHFVLQCNHTLGHTVPQDIFQPAIDFLFKHEFSKKPSPFANALPIAFPSYCKIMK